MARRYGMNTAKQQTVINATNTIRIVVRVDLQFRYSIEVMPFNVSPRSRIP